MDIGKKTFQFGCCNDCIAFARAILTFPASLFLFLKIMYHFIILQVTNLMVKFLNNQKL